MHLTAIPFKFKRDRTFDELGNFISDKADAGAAQRVYAVGGKYMRPKQNHVGPQPTHKSLYSGYRDDADRRGQIRLTPSMLFMFTWNHPAKTCHFRHTCNFRLLVEKHRRFLQRPSYFITGNEP
ncbi:hypothetical protein X801_00710 [Opisthorchis viverrini]|uniref:Uncharacterized protein n=1 Tax=Opisthorchis viverrini TaxID=6198 RepID=A0A1S8X9P6_OPIVI|nr:hypothetical protein X801_00710 [Opisthorchis viverrini]